MRLSTEPAELTTVHYSSSPAVVRRMESKPKSSRVIILMGVMGCGKTSTGKALAAKLGGVFVDADDHHPVGENPFCPHCQMCRAQRSLSQLTRRR